MDENVLFDKMMNCKLYGTPLCPHISKMKCAHIPVKHQGEKIKFFTMEQMRQDAEFCKECEKYEKE